MPAISSFFLVLSLALAVVLGPQTRAWSWGPALAALCIALFAAFPVIWKRGKTQADFLTVALGILVVGWFGWRAWTSPVAELGQADLLLVCGAVGFFVCIRSIAGHSTAERILAWGVALILLASVVVVAMQVADPAYSPVFRARSAERMISGFYAHYNEAANYFIASSLLVGAAALLGRHAPATRLLFGVIALAGLACVWLTHSRGGIFGAAIGGGVFAAMALVVAKRRKSRWFAPAVIAIPIVILALGAFWIIGWQNAQQVRQAGSGIKNLLDNDIRLYLLGMAVSCVSLHPLLGGGSRSFSWECYGFFGSNLKSYSAIRPDMVHNELMQSATDYGLIGAGLLLGLLGTLLLVVVLNTLFEESPQDRDSRDAWRVGALSALAGMLVQSCFSFVFHLMPGILLLGICLGQMSRATGQNNNKKNQATRILLSLVAAACAVLLLPAAWKGCQVTRILWPEYFGNLPPMSPESRIDILTEAIHVWPLSDFYQERAGVLTGLAAASDEAGFKEAAERAVNDYQEAANLNRFDPGFAVFRADLLSRLQRDTEAEEDYARAIRLEGGMEPGYRAHFSLAVHFLRKGLRLRTPETSDQRFTYLTRAAEEIEIAFNQTPYAATEMWDMQICIHEKLGIERELRKDLKGALESYNRASTFLGGARAHYRASVLLGKMAADVWFKRRPSEALSLFMTARQRIAQAGKILPEGVTLAQHDEYLAYLDRSIAFLKGANVEPSK